MDSNGFSGTAINQLAVTAMSAAGQEISMLESKAITDRAIEYLEETISRLRAD